MIFDTLLPLVMDILVLVALAGTIYYCMRLSKNIEALRSYKSELKSTIAELTRNIEKAEKSVDYLKETSLSTGDQLKRQIIDGQSLSEELQLVTQTAENLANRLEGLASEASAGRRLQNEKSGGKNEKKSEFPEKPFRKKQDMDTDNMPSFFIQDRDIEDGMGSFDDPSLSDPLDEDEDMADTFISQAPPKKMRTKAEQELYDALQKNRKKSSGS